MAQPSYTAASVVSETGEDSPRNAASNRLCRPCGEAHAHTCLVRAVRSSVHSFSVFFGLKVTYIHTNAYCIPLFVEHPPSYI